MDTNERDEFYKLEAKDYKGNTIKFSVFRGLTLIIANVASSCGLAKSNYQSFSDLIDKYYDKGLRILLFPCNQFLNQESGSIETVCEYVNFYSDKFILFEKVNVYGKDISPVFKHLVKYSSGFLGGFLKWNYTKFVIDREGKIVKRYGPNKTISCEDKFILDLMEDKASCEKNNDGDCKGGDLL